MRERGAILAARVDAAVVAHGDIDKAIDGEAAAIRCVIGAAEAEIETEPGQDVLLPGGHAVARVVVVGGEIRRVHDVEHAGAVALRSVPDHAARALDFAEGLELIGMTVALGVAHADDAAARMPWLIAVATERAVFVNGDEEGPIDCRAHGGRVTALRRFGENGR